MPYKDKPSTIHIPKKVFDELKACKESEKESWAHLLLEMKALANDEIPTENLAYE